MTLQRPRSVVVASTLFAALAGAAVLTTVALLLCVGRLASTREHLLAVTGSSDDARRTIAVVGGDLRYQTVIAVATALVVGVLALGVRRPSQTTRVVALMSAFALGLAWACGAAQSTETRIQRPATEPPEVRQAFEGLLPAWYPTATSIATAAALGLLAAAAVALLRSSAAEYYRREVRVLAPYVPRPDAGGPGSGTE